MLRFKIDDLPKSLKVRITSMREFEASINDFRFMKSPATNWKQGDVLDLAPHVVIGKNILQVNVVNREGPPTLLVEGRKLVRSGRRWHVVSGVESAVLKEAAVIGHDEVFLKDKEIRIWSTKYNWILWLCVGAYLLFLFYSIVPLHLKPWIKERAKHSPTDSSFIRKHGLCLTLLVVVAGVQLLNVARYQYLRSNFDAGFHADYVRHVAQHWSLPRADEGFEMYQPPLFYFCGAVVYKLSLLAFEEEAALKAVQVMNSLMGLLNLLCLWLLLISLFPQQKVKRNLGFAAVAFLPMTFYMNPTMTNEVFVGSLIALTMLLVVKTFYGRLKSWQSVVMIGAACGLCMLTKYTGLFITTAVFLILFFRWITRKEEFKRVALFIVAVLLVCGWLYVRNAVTYGDPFIGNWDSPSGQKYEQTPGYRTAGFYSQFGPFLRHEPGRSLWSGFWEGMYSTTWGDSHGTFVDRSGGETVINATRYAILWLALLPTLGIVVGFCRAVVFLIRRNWDHPYFVLVGTTLLSFVALLFFTMEVPFHSTVKGFFLLSLVPAYGVFGALGLNLLCSRLGRLRWLVYTNLAVLDALILFTFFYRGA